MTVEQALLYKIKNNDPTLTKLDLSYNKIGAEGAIALAEALKVNTTLTILNLSINQIGDEGTKAFAEALKVNTTLTSLNLSYNKIGDEGAKALAEALKVNTTLTSLSLSYNIIGAEGAKAFAEALKVNTTLTSLSLSSNIIRAEGAKAFAEALKVNTTLTFIDLYDNNIGAEGAKAFAEVLKVNTTLTSLSLPSNNIGAEEAKALAEVFKYNLNIIIDGIGSSNIGELSIRNKHNALQILKRLKQNTYDELNNIETLDLLRHLCPRFSLVKYLVSEEEYKDEYASVDVDKIYDELMQKATVYLFSQDKMFDIFSDIQDENILAFSTEMIKIMTKDLTYQDVALYIEHYFEEQNKKSKNIVIENTLIADEQIGILENMKERVPKSLVINNDDTKKSLYTEVDEQTNKKQKVEVSKNLTDKEERKSKKQKIYVGVN